MSAQDPWDEQVRLGRGFCEVGLSEAAAISPCVTALEWPFMYQSLDVDRLR